CRAGGGKRAHALLLLQEQGRALSRRAGACVRRHSPIGEGTRTRYGGAARRDPTAGPLHLELPERSSGVHYAAEQREPPPRGSRLQVILRRGPAFPAARDDQALAGERRELRSIP